MSWHCAPLKSEGAFSLSGNPMRGKPQSVSNQKGSSPCLQSEDCWSQSPICWPLVTVSNLLTSTNNRWLAYRTVIIARWYISQCHAMITTLFTSQTHSIPQSQTLILSIHNSSISQPQRMILPIPFTFQYPCPSTKNIYNFTTNSITFHRITYQHCCQSTTSKYTHYSRKITTTRQDTIYIMYEVSLYKNNRV